MPRQDGLSGHHVPRTPLAAASNSWEGLPMSIPQVSDPLQAFAVSGGTPPGGTPETPSTPRPCLRCGAIDTPAIGPGAGPHWRSLRCRHCNAWWDWLSRYTPAEREARRQAARAEAMSRKPPSQFQIAYLTALGYAGPPPATMREASQRIDALLQQSQAHDHRREDSVP